MALTTAERNRRKRERKKRERDEQRKSEDDQSRHDTEDDNKEPTDVEIEYVPEPLHIPDVAADFESLRRLQERSSAVITDDERQTEIHLDQFNEDKNFHNENEYSSTNGPVSKRKLKEMIRPSVADLKRKVKRPDLVEAHDITSSDPEFLIYLKSVPGSVPVPRHWGRKRKYLQGKRGFEKPPFQLPDFIVKTGITEIRDTVATEEANMSVRQKNRMRVAPKMGSTDVDYRTLHDAFFKHQTKPSNLTKIGDLYYEGKELESKATSFKPGKPLSKSLRDALGMPNSSSPPPWLINMQRYGPPPSWPGLVIPGLNAPLPNSDCQYGFHPGGWGKPPIDFAGRPLYGGNPFDPPGSSFKNDMNEPANLVTSDGKTVLKSEWGALPTGHLQQVDEEESSEDDMETSSSEEEEEEEEEEGVLDKNAEDGVLSALPMPTAAAVAPASLRKSAAGDETPLLSGPPKQLYQVIEQRKTTADPGAVFASEVAYVVPSSIPSATAVPEGAESVLSKVLPAKQSTRSKRKDDDEEEDLGRNYKF